MGCGTSTLLSDNAAIQAKVRPIIRRRIDDIKRRRDLQKGSTPSKKELLAGDDCEKMSSVNNDSLGSKSKSIPTEDSVELKASNKIVPVLEEEEEEEEEENGSINVEGTKKLEEEEKHENDAEDNRQEENEAELELEEHDDDDDEEDDDGRCISPGSPSFRFYCVEAVPHDTNDNDDQECHSESPTKKPESVKEHPASFESSAEADLPQRNPETRNNPKRKINRKIRSVMNKGGQVKSLLKVKSCYNPRCSGTNHRHDKAHLLQQATAAAL